ncbi:meiosis-specific nuclear structural protein 1-like [Macrosteles quadrilineatus]|uniref:meiosis-specific nuclear structural protein 1-like n=1 Tax=Macrosteles quadrilineatus TaxID=74068 RepID=UPI0023E1D691|nr:meiosis-specific nuclear structural protein 1-like [Macrosteles quadrilineatus]
MEERTNIQAEQRQNCLETLRSKMDMKAEKMVLERRMQMERGLEQQLEDERKITGNTNTLERHEEGGTLARALHLLELAHLREVRMMERITAASEELKALDKKRREAYVNKHLTTQLAEKEAVTAQEKLEKSKIQEITESEKKCMEEKADMNVSFIHAEKLKYREESLEQIKEGNQNQRDTQRDRILENALLEQTLRKIREEDEIEEAARLERVSSVKREIEGLKKQREMQKQREKLSREAEEARIKAYADEKENQEEKEKEEKMIIDFILLHLNGSKIYHRNEREDILELVEEEEPRHRGIPRDEERAFRAERERQSALETEDPEDISSFINYSLPTDDELDDLWYRFIAAVNYREDEDIQLDV